MSSFLPRLIFTLCLSILFLQPQPSLAAANFSFVPLIQRAVTPHQISLLRTNNDKLPFHHNVTLTVTLTVGSPPQQVTMVLDTGSELSYLNCKKTSTITNVFNPLQSKSYVSIPCSSPICRTKTQDFPVPVTCDDKKICHAALSYADGTSIEGSLASDTFRFGKSVFSKTVFGCMDSGESTNPEEDAKTTGLLGLNLGSLSFVTQMSYQKFAYCIAARDSSGVLLLGETKLDWMKPLQYTPLVRRNSDFPLPYFNRVAYTVQLEGIKVGNNLLKLSKSAFLPDHTGAGQTMVDSGTRFSYLLGPVYTALKTEFISQTKNILRVYEDKNFVFQGAMDLCFRVPLGRRRPVLPSVTLVFQGAEMTVTADRLLYKIENMVRGTDSIECLTFGNSELLGVEAFLIGHHHQQNVWMEFDLQKWRVGFGAVQCEVASRRLGEAQ